MKFQHVTLYVALHLLRSQAQFAPMAFPQPMPMGMPAMPMPMPMVGPPRLPVVVMPYRSRTADNFRKKQKKQKKQKPRYESSDSSSGSSSSSSSSSDETHFRAEGHFKKRRQVLTPVVSYVTKDGYVVYQKKIKKDRAKDWLDLGKNSGFDTEKKTEDSESMDFEDKMKEKLSRMKKHRSKSKHKHHRD